MGLLDKQVTKYLKEQLLARKNELSAWVRSLRAQALWKHLLFERTRYLKEQADISMSQLSESISDLKEQANWKNKLSERTSYLKAQAISMSSMSKGIEK